MFDSPFVRRVAVSMNLLGMPFEHRNWSVGKEFELIRQFNPLGRVPALVLSDGESLIESGAILDYLDELAGAERALLPRSGSERREALKVMSTALGAAEKGIQQLYEIIFKPEEKRHEPWMQRCRQQMHGALLELERVAQARATEWLMGSRLTQADVTATCVYSYLCDALNGGQAWPAYATLGTVVGRCEALPEFARARAAFHPPTPQVRSDPPLEGAA